MQKLVFVVDDLDTNLTQAETALEEHYTVLTMSSAEKMFKLLGKMTPQLILLDIEMPGLNGFDAMDRLQADSKFATIPVIFVTAKRDTEIEERCYDMGAADFVPKPFADVGLLNRVRTHINLRALLKDCPEYGKTIGAKAM